MKKALIVPIMIVAFAVTLAPAHAADQAQNSEEKGFWGSLFKKDEAAELNKAAKKKKGAVTAAAANVGGGGGSGSGINRPVTNPNPQIVRPVQNPNAGRVQANVVNPNSLVVRSANANANAQVVRPVQNPNAQVARVERNPNQQR